MSGQGHQSAEWTDGVDGCDLGLRGSDGGSTKDERRIGTSDYYWQQRQWQGGAAKCDRWLLSTLTTKRGGAVVVIAVTDYGRGTVVAVSNCKINDSGKQGRVAMAEGCARCSGSSPGVLYEFAEGDRELVGSMPGVHQKMIERLAGSLLEDAEKFVKSLKDQIGMPNKND
ncbi:hypothetical protein GW17_00026495 [Ensete ventricosum]|nr:hypothetical protein GW17_00026495 [Ensete ventricosum]